MAVLKPFRGLRPPATLVGELSTPPYDVVSAAEAREKALGKEKSFFHISRPEVGLAEGVDEHSEEVYREGTRQLAKFLKNGWLVHDALPAYYAYRQKMGSHVQTGLVAAASVAAYDKGLIKKHELTRADKEDDRTRHIEALLANDEPVFLTYRRRAQIDELMNEATESSPAFNFQAEDGVTHTFWVVEAALNARLEQAFVDVPSLYIADGHHRSAAASRVRTRLAEQGKGGAGRDFFLTVVFPHNQMQILPYNRLVRDLAGYDPQTLAVRLRDQFEVSVGNAKEPSQPHHFGMYLDGRWFRLVARPGSFDNTPLGVLDVSILQANLLGPLLGIKDPRTDGRIGFVGGIRGLGELERRVNSEEYRVAFALHATSLDQLMAIADANAIMPPKSTWFEPKLRSGLVLHPFE